MNILIPMAGEGSRFKKEGYTFPKPLIEVDGKPMIQCVVENLDFDANYIFLVRDEHLSKYNIESVLKLLIANSDQIIEYSKENFNTVRRFTNFDASVFTFRAVHPKWSFVKTNSRGVVTEVAEKNPISDIATCGIYYYRKGSDFVKYAEEMIEKDIRVNNEFYIAPVYNELILDEKTLVPFFVDKMHGLGTPEDLKKYLSMK
jgi:dTDP-glucose pyrophosphorylase